MRILFLLVILIITAKTASQNNSRYYSDLSTKRNLQAFIFLGGGTVLVLVGEAIIEKKYDPAEPNKDNIGYVIASTGCLSILTSIVFFTAALSQKEKRLGLKFKTVPVLQSNAFLIRQIPSLSITISI